jgi:hypothetical protein
MPSPEVDGSPVGPHSVLDHTLLHLALTPMVCHRRLRLRWEERLTLLLRKIARIDEARSCVRCSGRRATARMSGVTVLCKSRAKAMRTQQGQPHAGKDR